MIPALLLRILKPVLPYLVVAAVVAASLLYVSTIRGDLRAANAKNVALTQNNQADVVAIAAYKAQAIRWTTALAAMDARTSARNTSVVRIYDKIGGAAAGDDGSVAPVLTQALDSLRALQGTAP